MAKDERAPSAAEFLPPERSIPALQNAASACRGCDLWKDATQTVFGAGSPNATVVLVGEQPGDREDLEGAPFVGPAGRMLDKALEDAGIARDDTYVTNAVKHFKWQPKGKRRIHQRPNAEEIRACRPWLDAEIAALRPRVIVCLGATAAQALLGKTFRVTKQRGEFVEWPLTRPVSPLVTATVHPSSILRSPDGESRRAAYAEFVSDLRRVARKLAEVRSEHRAVAGATPASKTRRSAG